MKKVKAPKKESPKQTCSMCGKTMVIKGNFYSTPNKLFATGYAPFCKTCLNESVEDMELLDGLMEVLQKVDRPFVSTVWESSVKANAPIGDYLRQVASLPQYKELTFKDSEKEKVSKASSNKKESILKEALDGQFEVTSDIILKWGEGYTDFEYMKMEKYWNDMMQSYEIETPQHKEDLEQLAKLNVEKTRLLEEKDYTNLAKISKTADDIQKSAGFRAIDRKSGAEATGLFSFSQVWQKIEQEGFIEPKLHSYPKDDIDYMLMYYIQFTQRLTGKEVSSEPNHNWREEVIDDEQL